MFLINSFTTELKSQSVKQEKNRWFYQKSNFLLETTFLVVDTSQKNYVDTKYIEVCSFHVEI